MLGIRSYKDLHYWESLWPNSNPGKHNWYIILLSNLNYQTPAMRLVFNNYEYLHYRTKNIRYFIPGLLNEEKGIYPLRNRVTTNPIAFSERFYVDGFIETVEWLENNNPAYKYNEGIDMILLPYTRQEDSATDKEEYDFKHMLWYCLDDLMNQGINLISFIKRAVKVVSEDMSYEETKAHMERFASGAKDEPTIKVSIIKNPVQRLHAVREKNWEPWSIRISVNGEAFDLNVGSKDQRMVYVCTLIRQKLGEHIYLHEFFRNSKGQNCKFTKNGSEEWLRKVYNLLFNHPARNFSEWMEKVDDTANRGRSINQGKSQINASLKKLLKGFNMNASKLPVIDTMKDENKDSYYTTILKPENINIPEEFLSIPLPVEK